MTLMIKSWWEPFLVSYWRLLNDWSWSCPKSSERLSGSLLAAPLIKGTFIVSYDLQSVGVVWHRMWTTLTTSWSPSTLGLFCLSSVLMTRNDQPALKGLQDKENRPFLPLGVDFSSGGPQGIQGPVSTDDKSPLGRKGQVWSSPKKTEL